MEAFPNSRRMGNGSPGQEGARLAVFVVPTTGGSPRRLAAGLTMATHPVWSPDGKHLALLGSQEDKGPTSERMDWWISAADGGEPIRTGAFATLFRQGVYREGESGI